jgi:hypothetical protein
MGKPYPELFKRINRTAHAVSHAYFEQKRDELRAKALELLRIGVPKQEVSLAIVKGTLKAAAKK